VSFRAYRVLDESATLNHTNALEHVAFAYLFGDYLRWNPKKAKDMFEHLSHTGSPKGQVGLGFMHSAGIHANSSQVKVSQSVPSKKKMGMQNFVNRRPYSILLLEHLAEITGRKWPW